MKERVVVCVGGDGDILQNSGVDEGDGFRFVSWRKPQDVGFYEGVRVGSAEAFDG